MLSLSSLSLCDSNDLNISSYVDSSSSIIIVFSLLISHVTSSSAYSTSQISSSELFLTSEIFVGGLHTKQLSVFLNGINPHSTQAPFLSQTPLSIKELILV